LVKKILLANPKIKDIEIRKQLSAKHIFKGIVKPSEVFDLCICNPPFHSSLAEAREGTARKIKNLSSGKNKKVVLNFGGQHAELWCEGGEKVFVTKMIVESSEIRKSCLWFSSLISKSINLPALYKELERVKALDVAKYLTIGTENLEFRQKKRKNAKRPLPFFIKYHNKN